MHVKESIYPTGNIFRIILPMLICFISCSSDTTTNPPEVTDPFQPPAQINDGWQTAKPSDVNLNPDYLTQMTEYIDRVQNHSLHSLLIIKDDKLVFEKYYDGFLWDPNYENFHGRDVQYDENELHYLASISKSVTSVLLGIAYDQNLIEPIDTKIKDYYPEFSSIMTAGKEDISIKHLLTMTSGLSWDESTYPYGDSRNDASQLFAQSNPIKFILSKPLISAPGAKFHYNSGNTNVIADIIQKKTGAAVKQFAEVNLFDPLGINNYRWDMIRGNYIFASGGLFLTPRSLAKIGSLFLNGGYWNGVQIVSKKWIDESITSYSDPHNSWSNGYGYQWWLTDFSIDNKKFHCYCGAGWGEQYLFIFPEEKLIAVFNSGYYTGQPSVNAFYITKNFILRALN